MDREEENSIAQTELLVAMDALLDAAGHCRFQCISKGRHLPREWYPHALSVLRSLDMARVALAEMMKRG
jgi:hypothetical protein